MNAFSFEGNRVTLANLQCDSEGVFVLATPLLYIYGITLPSPTCILLRAVPICQLNGGTSPTCTDTASTASSKK